MIERYILKKERKLIEFLSYKVFEFSNFQKRINLVTFVIHSLMRTLLLFTFIL